MTALAPTLQLFFTERLARQLQASPQTVISYRNTFRLLLRFIQQRTGKAPSQLDWDDLGAEAISAFLDHLEDSRGNTARSRNARLAALRSLFRYAALRHPSTPSSSSRSWPSRKNASTAHRSRSSPPPKPACCSPPPTPAVGRPPRPRPAHPGRPDGLRLSELTGLTCSDIQLTAPAHVRCTGKGRKQRCVPLTPATAAVRVPGGH